MFFEYNMKVESKEGPSPLCKFYSNPNTSGNTANQSDITEELPLFLRSETHNLSQYSNRRKLHTQLLGVNPESSPLYTTDIKEL